MKLNPKYYAEYKNKIGNELHERIEAFDFSEENVDFSHRIIVSAVYSSNIEGNSIDLNSI